jgi:glycosyltransferase involved in cell wall biosynthesis
VNVLYVSHTSTIGGGERSLLDLIGALPDDIQPSLAAPDGELASAAAALGVPWTAIEGSAASLRFDLQSMPRELRRLGSSLRAVRAAARTMDVVHANSVRAGLLSAAAGSARVVVHVRDVLPPGRTSDVVKTVVRHRANTVVANSEFTARAFGGPAVVAPPWVDETRFAPAEQGTRGAPLLGIVGQITPWKGQLEAIEILAGVRQSMPEARLLVCGSVRFQGTTRYDNPAYERLLHERVEALGLTNAVDFAGERGDVEAVLRVLDVLLVPSWEEPFGRVVIEGMATGLPVVATSVGGPASIIHDGIDGLVLPPRKVDVWVEAVAGLLADPDRRAILGAAARGRALSAYSRDACLEPLLRVYRGAA